MLSENTFWTPAFGRLAALDDAAAHAAQQLDARGRPAVDGALYRRHEQKLRQQESGAERQRPRLEIGHVADHAQQDAGLQQRLGERKTDEAADRLGLGHHHGGVGADLPRLLGSERVAVGMDGSAKGAHGILAHPAAIDIERQLEALLEQRHAGIGDGEPQDGAGGARLDCVVDDAPLQLQRHGAQPEHAGRQGGQSKLMEPRLANHVADDRPRQPGSIHVSTTPRLGRRCAWP